MDINKSLMEAVRSSEMENLRFTREEIETAEKILNGEMTLEEYFKIVKAV